MQFRRHILADYLQNSYNYNASCDAAVNTLFNIVIIETQLRNYRE